MSFHGAHRAELPFWRENLLYIIIIGAAAVLLVVLLFFIGGMGGNGDDDRAEDPTSAAEQSEEESAAEETEAAEEEPAPEPDLSTPVLVVNAGGIDGLAGTWQDTLEGDGWEDVSVATADNPSRSRWSSIATRPTPTPPRRSPIRPAPARRARATSTTPA
ncbi:LytR C-terminal domain-containing protein [Brachybacterium sp. Z12]|uniref:LytR C-terminal domain-containing protein n=1 Tax=Brachybacterium sp. Z12 TaxID=2759167 RepID=UPI00223B5AA0|nr:LytR C-terminal domain-containing protein [Brachybacterium sp. Z12]